MKNNTKKKSSPQKERDAVEKQQERNKKPNQVMNYTMRSEKGSVSAARTNPSTRDLRSLLIDELKDIYWAEKALEKAIPNLARKASSRELIHALTSHLDDTKGHITRLEEVFSALGEPAKGKKCEAMDGLIREGDSLIGRIDEGAVRDAAIIVSAQKVEHYEIATYGTLCAFADTLGETRVSALLKEILKEEKNADAKLTQVALTFVNNDAVNSAASDDGADDKIGPISS